MQFVTLKSEMQLHLTVGVCERLKAAGIIDINELPVNPQSFADMQSSPAMLVKVAWEMSDKTLSLERFGDMIDGDALPLLWDSVTKEIACFFQEPMRTIIIALIEKVAERQTVMTQNMMAAILGVPSEDGEPYGSLQESSELMLDSSVFVNSTTWPEEDSELSGVAIVA